MTKDQTRRVLEAIADCDRFIAKEGQRNQDLRPASEAQHLEFCKAHKAKLENAMATGVWVA